MESGTKKKILIAGGVALVLIGAAYGGGRWQGHQQTEAVRSDMAELQTKHETMTQELNAEIAEAEDQVKQCQRRAERLDARRQLHLALHELRELNFGYSKKHLKAAGDRLASAAGNDEPIAELAGKMQKTEIEPTSDLDETRDRLMRLAERFDELVPPK